MLTALFYFFVFSTWGIGLLCLLSLLGDFITTSELNRKEKALELSHKTQLFDKINSFTDSKPPALPNFPQGFIPAPADLPEKVKELMKSSPNHPEVNEIDGSEPILGVRFEAENYPPGFGEGDE